MGASSCEGWKFYLFCMTVLMAWKGSILFYLGNPNTILNSRIAFGFIQKVCFSQYNGRADKRERRANGFCGWSLFAIYLLMKIVWGQWLTSAMRQFENASGFFSLTAWHLQKNKENRNLLVEIQLSLRDHPSSLLFCNSERLPCFQKLVFECCLGFKCSQREGRASNSHTSRFRAVFCTHSAEDHFLVQCWGALS